MGLNGMPDFRRAPVCIRLLIGTFLLAPAAWAQTDNDSEPEDVAAATEPEGVSPDDDEVADADASDWERLIYLPFRDLQNVFENQEGSVVLPYVEYLKLWNAKHGGTDKPDEPTVGAVITEAAYVTRVEKDVAHIDATFRVQVLGKPWVDIPVAFGDAAVGKVTSETGTALLRGRGNGQYSLLLSEKGEQTIRLELSARIHTSPDGRSFEFKCPSVGITTFELEVPAADQSIELTPGIVALPVDADADTTRIKASLGATTRIAARWNPQAGLKPEMDLLTSVTSYSRVTIEEGLLRTDAQLKFDILRGELTELEFAIPKDHRVLDVTAVDSKVKGWKIQDEANRQLVTVEMLGEVSEAVVIEVHTEASAPEDAVRVTGIDDDGTFHGIHALGAIRESGQVVVAHGPDLTLAIDEQTGLSRINANEVHSSIRRDSALAYRYYNPQANLTVSVSPVQPSISVASTSQIVFGDDSLRLITNATWTIERAGVFELRVEIPNGLTVETVRCAGMSEYAFDEESRELIISLAEKKLGMLGSSIFCRRTLSRDEQSQLNLPLLAPKNADRENGTVAVYAPPAIEVITDDENVVGVFPEPAGKTARSVGRAALLSVWSYSRRPVTIPVRTERKPTRLTATAGTTIDVQQELVRVTTRLVYSIENAGIDTFRFSVPEAVSERVQIRSLTTESGGTIKQKSAAEPADGRVIWTVITQQEFVGNRTFEISWDLKPETDEGDTREFELTVEPLQILDPADVAGDDSNRITLSRVVGEVVATKDRALSVMSEATGDDIELIDVRELQSLPKQGFLAWRYYKQPVSLTLSAARHEIQEVVQTVVSRAVAEVVLDRDPMATYLCRYRMKSSERQRLRVDLPASVELHDPLVDGRKVALERSDDATAEDGWEPYYVNVARTRPSDEDFMLTLHFRAPVAGPQEQLFEGWSAGQFVRLPVIGGSDGNTVVVQQTKTIVRVPEEFAIVGTPDRFNAEGSSQLASMWPMRLRQPEQQKRVSNWIGTQGGGIVDFPRLGHAYHFTSLGDQPSIDFRWWHMPRSVWWLSGIVLVVGFVLRRTSWENKLTIVLLAAFAAALYALKDREIVAHIAAASAYGIAGTAVLWLIHALTGNGAAGPTPALASGPAATTSPPTSDSSEAADTSESTGSAEQDNAEGGKSDG